MKNKKALLLVLPVLTIILEALPSGAVLNFANPEGEPIRKTFSYFSMTPFGYANFAPFITAIITCAIFVLLLVYSITEKELVFKAVKSLLAVGIVLSLCPLGFGVKSFSPVAGLIFVSLLAELVLMFAVKKILYKTIK